MSFVSFQTSPPRLLQSVGTVLRNLHRFLEVAFGRGKVVTPPVSARELEEEERVERLFVGRLLNQAYSLLVILPSPGLPRFPAEALDRRIRLF